MNLKRTILTACLLFMVWPGIAIAKEEPIIYTVKQGDTLWDISQRFIKDPYYWPNLWSNNPAIGNDRGRNPLDPHIRRSPELHQR